MAMAAVLALPACRDGRGPEEDSAEDGAEDGDDDDDDGDDDDGPDEEPTIEISPVPLQHLTRAQYSATVADLWPGAPTQTADAFSFTDPRTGEVRQIGALDPDDTLFGFDLGTSMSAFLPEQYFDRAEAIAALAMADLDLLLACEPSRACAQTFAQDFGLRAYRRPPTSEEVDDLLVLFDTSAQEYDFEAGIETMVFAMLTSPHFLYRVVPVDPDATSGDSVRVDDWEMASRLSYFLLGSMPDDALFAAAAAGELSTADQVVGQADRLLASSRGSDGLESFFRQWLNLAAVGNLQKDPNVQPDFDPRLGPDLRASLEAQLEALAEDPDTTVADLFHDDRYFLNERLASLYEVDGVSGDALQPVTMPQRAGLIGHPGVLALHSKKEETQLVARGIFVRKRLLCRDIPPPPADVMLDLPPPDPSDPPDNMREHFERHVEDPSCAGCHQVFDPIGFGFENFDGLGRYRTQDVYGLVDPAGALVGADEADGPFADFFELNERLADATVVQTCLSQKMFEVAVARPADPMGDRPEIQRVAQTGDDTDWNIRELAVAIAGSESFRSTLVP